MGIMGSLPETKQEGNTLNHTPSPGTQRPFPQVPRYKYRILSKGPLSNGDPRGGVDGPANFHYVSPAGGHWPCSSDQRDSHHAVYHPQADGLVERYNVTLKSMERIYQSQSERLGCVPTISFVLI